MLSDTLAIRREHKEIRKQYDEIWFALSDEERKLTGPNGELSWGVQRTALELSQSDLLHRVVFRALRIGHTVGRRLRMLVGRRAPNRAESPQRFLDRWSKRQHATMSDRARSIVEAESNAVDQTIE